MSEPSRRSIARSLDRTVEIPLILADVQVLFYAIDPTRGLHAAAARWLEDATNGREPVGRVRPTLHPFFGLGTHPAFPGCMTDDEAIATSQSATLASFDSDLGAQAAHGLRWEKRARS